MGKNSGRKLAADFKEGVEQNARPATIVYEMCGRLVSRNRINSLSRGLPLGYSRVGDDVIGIGRLVGLYN